MKIKAILINAIEKTVSEIQINSENSLKEFYSLIGCDCITRAPLKENDDDFSLFVDDEGLLKGPENFFYYNNAWQPLAGNGVLIGCDPNTGENCDVSINIIDVLNNIRFASVNELRLLKMFGADIENYNCWPKLNHENN